MDEFLKAQVKEGKVKEEDVEKMRKDLGELRLVRFDESISRCRL